MKIDETPKRAATATELADMAAALDSLLSVSDVARLLNRSEGQVRNLRWRKILPEPIKVPNRGLRWTPEQIKTYIASLTACI
jgi:predicted DNA-binding transcriptional regulator AlpA